MIIIPVRLESTRLYHKALQYIGHLPMVVRTAKACQAAYDGQVVVASDSEEVLEVCLEMGVSGVLTGPADSGTDRVALACDLMAVPDDEIVINVQGDYPFVNPADIKRLSNSDFSHDRDCHIYTLVQPLVGDQQHDRDKVKAVFVGSGRATYFSRMPVPTNGPFYEHVGIYAYTAKTLREFTNLPRKEIEKSEDIEHLRVITWGIKCLVSDFDYIGVNTPEDLLRANQRAIKERNEI